MILLAGENTQLASYLLPLLRNEYQVCSFDSNKGDLCDSRFLNDLFNEISPLVCINCEEVRDYTEAEVYRERAYTINSFGADCLAQICRKKDVPLIHVSSSSVYDQSTADPKGEDAPLHPLSTYSDSKLLGEEKIRQSGCRYCILRCTDIFGRNDTILMPAFRDAKEGRRITIVRGSKIMPVSAADVSSVIMHVLRNNLEGIYNVSGPEMLTQYQFLFRFFDLYASIRKKELKADVVEVDYERFLYPVDLPRNNCADNARIKETAGDMLTPLDESLSALIQEL